MSATAEPGGGDEARGVGSGAGATTSVSGTPMAVDLSGDRRSRAVWVAFLAGPVIWFTHFMVVYLVVEAGCTGDGPGLWLFDPPVPTVFTLAATALAAVASAAAAWWAHRRWRASPEQPGPDDDRLIAGPEQHDHGGTLAFAGFLMSSLAFMTVLLVGVPAAILPAC